jgi:hypothetical protein
MKSVMFAIAAASALSLPLASFAQSTDNNGPKTRAEVKQELIQVEQAGYNPALGNDPYYPADIQAAEQRVQAEHGSAVAAGDTASTSGYGGVAAGSSQAGGPTGNQTQRLNPDGTQPTFFGR